MSLSIKNTNFSSFHFVGILGSGMSALAQYLCWQGCQVSGSDRASQSPATATLTQQLQALGCTITPQDGSGIGNHTQIIVVSTAIEDDNPDIAQARARALPIVHRSDVLAAIVAQKKTIAVAGTSGKSTVTALCFSLLRACGLDPCLISGANIHALTQQGAIGNAYYSSSPVLVIEADESDGTLIKYHPHIALILNISKDHKPVNETMELFAQLAAQSHTVITNADYALLDTIEATLRFGINHAAQVQPQEVTSLFPMLRFTYQDTPYQSPLIGEHNLANVLAALAVGECLGCAPQQMAQGIGGFEGLARRFNRYPTRSDITVIDDFAHNPEKIRAALLAAQMLGKRVWAVFQPHGFGPMRFLRDELIATIATTLRPQDHFIFLPIFYAGGTAQQDISSELLSQQLQQQGAAASHSTDRQHCQQFLREQAQPGDVVLLMGARDPSLPQFVQQVLAALQSDE